MRKLPFISLEQGSGVLTGPDISNYYFGSTMRSDYILQCYQAFSIICQSFISHTFLSVYPVGIYDISYISLYLHFSMLKSTDELCKKKKKESYIKLAKIGSQRPRF